jgi:DNA-binding beta-propeller fold protein YncE
MSKALALSIAVGVLLASTRPTRALGSFVEFESGQVRPLALSPDGSKLFAVNTPDNRLEIFDVDGSGNLAPAGSVPVGMEPVAVAARTNTEVWVVNHLSDSVSIVSLASSPPRVVNTLLVGDEPRDIVFAGSDGAGHLVGNRAFITTAHRGQNSGVPASDFISEGLERADVWVFDATNLGTALGGTPVTVVELFGDTPRALARNGDGSRVYAAVFQSGNRTTTINEALVCNWPSPPSTTPPGPCTISGNTAPGGLPPPGIRNCAGATQPETGLIVKFNGTQWVDELGRNWSPMVKFSLPDQDVFALDADAGTPALTGTPWSGVGTVLFNMAVNPNSGRIYVSNTEAKNERRFEGPGSCSTTVQGRLHQARITVLDGASVNPRHLNKHIDYDVRPAPLTTKQRSLATPTDLVVTPDGATLYVAAFGSSKIGIFATAQLEADTFTPDASSHIPVSGGGPSGLVLRGNRLYVFTRFDNGISTIDTTTQAEIDHRTLFNPEPARVVTGRPVLYDAFDTSSNGEASCSSCHVFGDFDGLAWDLGNPDDSEVTSPIPQQIPTSFTGSDPDFFPMKGPMTTQSLRGLANHGAMHWRGDRSVGFFGTSAFDEKLSFKNFIVAFPGLVGRASQISQADMQKFADFMLDVVYPPNPIRNLDNSLTGAQQAGSNVYFGATTDTLFNCNGCHQLDPALGHFGTNRNATFEGETQHFKIAHLRNAYQKIGMFGMPAVPNISTSEPTTPQGPQVRGFGFLHDGSIPTVHRFLGASVFSTSDTQERNLEAFILAYPSTLAPIVGQQITLTATNAATVGPRIALLIQRAQTAFALVNHPGARECDLIVKGTVGGEQRGWRMSSVSGAFLPDKAGESSLTDAQLRALANTPGQELTYTCAPPGSGVRMGIDRDADGILDGDEGAPPAGGCAPAPQGGCALPGKSQLIVKQNTDDAKDKVTWKWLLGTADVADFGSPDVGDGYGVCMYQGGSLVFSAEAPASGICGSRPCWRNGGASGFRYSDSARTPDGLLKLVLRPGAGTAKVTAKGKGANLTLPALPLTMPVTVQVQGSHGRCWEHVYNSAGVVRNDTTQFKGHGG